MTPRAPSAPAESLSTGALDLGGAMALNSAGGDRFACSGSGPLPRRTTHGSGGRRPAPREGARLRNREESHDHDHRQGRVETPRQDRRRDLSRLVREERCRPGRLLGRARQADRLDQAVFQGEEHLLRPRRHRHPLVRGRHAQRRRQLRRPAPRNARRSGGHPVGGRRSGRFPGDHLPRAARGSLPHGERPQGARRQARRPGDDLHADDPRSGLCDARFGEDRRGPFRRLRRLLPRCPGRAAGGRR